MVSTVKARPNHYEALGLNPAASDAEIAPAFARQMALFRPMADAAQIGIAFETLRNPIKRRAYDTALGLRAEPPRPSAPTAVAFKISARFNDLAARPAQQPRADDPSVNPPPSVNSLPRADEPAEHRAGSFIAASLRPAQAPEPRRAAPALAVQPERPVRPPADLTRIVQSDSGEYSAANSMRLSNMDEAEDRSFAPGRTGAMVGGVILAVALIGAWAGTQVGSAEVTPPAKPAASVALPPVEGVAETIASLPAPMPNAVEVRPGRSGRARIALPQVERIVASPQPVGSDLPQSVASRSVGIGQSDGALAENTVAPPAADAPRVAATAANLPLPNAVIARTIERIGYSCGKIGSSAAVAGGTGVFNVTCTSGQSYQATPVRGRYHFRRVKGR